MSLGQFSHGSGVDDIVFLADGELGLFARVDVVKVIDYPVSKFKHHTSVRSVAWC